MPGSEWSLLFFSPPPFSFAFPLPPAGALHSRVYHCPDNNDLPTGEALREGPRVGAQEKERRGEEKKARLPGRRIGEARVRRKKKERSRGGGCERERGGESGSRSATLHSGVFHFNGPPGDWLTRAVSPFICPLARSPQRFRHNGPGALLIRAGRTVSPRPRQPRHYYTAVHLVQPATKRDSGPFLSVPPSSPSFSSSPSSSSYFRFRSLPASIGKN